MIERVTLHDRSLPGNRACRAGGVYRVYDGAEGGVPGPFAASRGLRYCQSRPSAALNRMGTRGREHHLLSWRGLLRCWGRVPQLLRDLLRPWRGRMCCLLCHPSSLLPVMPRLPNLGMHASILGGACAYAGAAAGLHAISVDEARADAGTAA